MNEPIADTELAVDALEAPAEAGSLKEHRAVFAPEAKRADTPIDGETPLERPRHRARSQQANPDDVAQIAELTKRARAAEEAIPIERKDGESERVYQLRRRAEIAESRRDATKPAVTETQVALPPASPKVEVSAFTEAEPKIEDFFANAKAGEDPYAQHVRALSAYDRRKEAFDARQTTTRDEATAAKDKWIKDTQEAHSARLVAHLGSNPADKALYDAEAAKPAGEQIVLTPIMRVAIETHGQGPSFVVELLKHPEFADDLMLQTNLQYAFDSEGRINPAVATMQRRLAARVQAVKTGAAVPERSVIVAPRPPTPVRTVPVKPSEKSSVSGPVASLREHRSSLGRR